VYALMVAGLHPGGWLIFLVAVLAAPAAAGLVAAWWTPRPDSPPGQRRARTLQGLAAGVVAGAAGALLITILDGQLLLLLGLPLAGALLGSLGGTVGAARPRNPRPGRSWSGGIVVISS
jgi:hypothetical protein